VRSPERAQALIEAGAHRVIAGSALFTAAGIDAGMARAFSDAIGADRWIAAIDSRGGHVTIHGWRTRLELTPHQAIAGLEGLAGGFLYTDVDVEGLLRGVNFERVRELRALTPARFVTAGGIRSREEVDRLDGIGADAVVGMAIYRGLIEIDSRSRFFGTVVPDA